MDRREFLITSGGAAVAAASAGAASQAGERAARGVVPAGNELKLAMTWADTPQGPADSARRLARRIESMTGGRYRIKVSAMSGGLDLAGDADLVHGTAHDLAPLHPAFSFFAGLPGQAGLSASDFANWLVVGGGQTLWDDLAGQHGWKPLLAGHAGEAPPVWSRVPISSLGDLAGRRVFAPGLGADVARALGAEAVALAPSQIAGAMRDDPALAVEAGGLSASLAHGLPRIASHATGYGLNGHGTALSLSIGLPLWDRLPEGDRAIFEAAAAEEYRASLAEAHAYERLAREALAASFGVRIAPWPQDIAEALDRVAEASIAHVAGHDPVAARIDHSYMAYRSMVSVSARPRRASPIA